MDIDTQVIWENSHNLTVETFMACEAGELGWEVFTAVNDAHNTISDVKFEEEEHPAYNRDIFSEEALHNKYVELFGARYGYHLNQLEPNDNNIAHAKNVAEECGSDFPLNMSVREDILSTAVDRIAYNDAIRIIVARSMHANRR
jgi:hypothetical protein